MGRNERGPREGGVQAGRRDLWALARRHEAPTWALVFIIYGGWLGLTWGWHLLPLWMVLPAGAWLSAWHMSLQHELIHGHPTRRQGINDALAWPPLNVWLPYAVYREQHLRHHRAAWLTDPLEDPESTYVSAAAWARAGAWRRWLHGANTTLAGRIVLGPACAIVRFWHQQMRAPAARRILLAHGAGVCLVLLWVSAVCRVNPVAYVMCFVYPGTSLTMIRSLAEHRAAARPEDRTAVVEPGGPLGLLFLYNNLHVLHHEDPSIPWYDMKARWRLARPHLLAGRHGPVYRGYLDVALQHGLRRLHPGPHPARP